MNTHRMEAQIKQRYEKLTEKLREVTADIDKCRSQLNITKKGRNKKFHHVNKYRSLHPNLFHDLIYICFLLGVGMFFVLCTMACTFIFLSSIFYKGWAFVLTSQSYFTGKAIPNLKGKTAIVTGYSASSISRSVVFELARKGCDVVATVDPSIMDSYNTDQLRKHLEYSVGYSFHDRIGSVKFIGVDMTSFKSIKKCIKKLLVKRLDILILNEDSFLSEYRSTEAGIEHHFAANYLGPFLFTKLLLKKIKRSRTRVLLTTNYAYRKAYPDVGMRFDLLNKETKDYRATHAYGQSKLALVSIVPSLDRILQGSHATINSIYPGLVTDTLMEEKSWVYGHNWFSSMTASSAALTILYAASSPIFTDVSGKHIEPAGVIMDKPPAYQANETMSNMLYKRSFTLSNQFFINF